MPFCFIFSSLIIWCSFWLLLLSFNGYVCNFPSSNGIFNLFRNLSFKNRTLILTIRLAKAVNIMILKQLCSVRLILSGSCHLCLSVGFLIFQRNNLIILDYSIVLNFKQIVFFIIVEYTVNFEESIWGLVQPVFTIVIGWIRFWFIMNLSERLIKFLPWF